MNDNPELEQPSRVQQVDLAYEQAYVEDFSISIARGTEPAMIQHSKSDLAHMSADYDRAVAAMRQSQSLNVVPDVPSTEQMEAAEQLQEAPAAQTDSTQPNAQKQPKRRLFSRTASAIKSPFKLAGALIERQQEAVKQNQLYVQNLRIEKEQTRLQNLIAQQQERTAAREAFKQSIRTSAKGLSDGIKGRFTQMGQSVKNTVQQTFAKPTMYVRDVVDSWNETKQFAKDTVDRGRQGVANVKASVSERHTPQVGDEAVIQLMSERMKDKHAERIQFNQDMKDFHGKDVGYRELDVVNQGNDQEAGQLAHLETRDFVSFDAEGTGQVDRNTSYYQYMLDMQSEKALADSNGQMDDAAYRDRAKELYEILLSEKGESESKQQLNRTLKESYQQSYPSTRLKLYLAKNPSLTGIDEGLTTPTVDMDVSDVSYNTDSFAGYDVSYELDEGVTPTENPFVTNKEQSINKEFNGVPIENEGYVDLNQEDAKVVHMETARMQRQGSVAAVASGKPSSSGVNHSTLRDVFRAEKKHSTQAIQQHKMMEQLSLDMGNLDGPSGP